jgi:flavin reductase (DIM6/NTAB) family NADH-FMN oxidoreductase RutF
MGIDRFRQGMRQVAGAVTVVTTRGPKGERRGVTATAVCSLSVEPPSLIACINRSSWVAQFAPASGVFAINVLAADQEAIARAFAGQTALVGEDRFQVGAWRDGVTGAPLVDDCLAAFDCRLGSAVDHASHVILVGQVAQTILRAETGAPLVYVNGTFATVSAVQASDRRRDGRIFARSGQGPAHSG